jgi:hypothetical protein
LAPAIVVLGVFGAPLQLPSAVLCGRATDVRAMIASGADVNAADAASQGQMAIARLLIAADARVADIDPDWTTATQW